MTWKEDARLDSLSQFKAAEPPAVADSDLIVVVINRLQRAVVKMQSREYDDELGEHLTKAADMLGWVAENVWLRGGDDPEEPAVPERPPFTRAELHESLRGFMDSLDDSVTAELATEAYRRIADDIERHGLVDGGE